jgi:hypothetical protein
MVLNLVTSYYYKETSQSGGPDLSQKYQETLKINQLIKLYHQKSGRYKFLRTRPPKDKHL